MRLCLLALIGLAIATSTAFADHPHTIGGLFGGAGGGDGRFKGDAVGHCEYLAARRVVLHRKSGSSMGNGWNPDPSPRIEHICAQYAPGNHEFFMCLKTSVHPVDSSGSVGELSDSQIDLCARQSGL
jgi:hypothetical protein